MKKRGVQEKEYEKAIKVKLGRKTMKLEVKTVKRRKRRKRKRNIEKTKRKRKRRGGS